ncbi:MAG: hypothetical protein EZS28_012243 [Streblomastix strix]|uniref:non-specific serine/threonine protein kinase n=1 Tax=Streblomastix strix TaxID=222440 RepID=A0A5J4WBC2_9EUKA|nr:MAG: hypothetical protein EZS28_012243 [Streblomastix strix]
MEKGMLFIVMDYAEYGNLSDRIIIKNCALMNEDEILNYFVQICLVFNHIYDHKILLIDLKGENIFLTKQNIVKLGDFDVSPILRNCCSTSLSETPAPPLYFEIAESTALFTHLRDGADLNTTPNQPLVDDRDSNRNDVNVFEIDREIAVTNADAGPAQTTQLMQEIQIFIMRFMKLFTGRNAFAIDFWANPITYAQIRDYKARTLHASEVTRHSEVPPLQILSNTANNRVGIYVQNQQFQILELYKLTILSIQHVLEGCTKETLSDLVSMCTALLSIAERSICIRDYVTRNSTIACFGTDIGTRKLGLSQHASRPILRNFDQTGTIDSAADPRYNNHSKDLA